MGEGYSSLQNSLQWEEFKHYMTGYAINIDTIWTFRWLENPQIQIYSKGMVQKAHLIGLLCFLLTI